MAKVLIGSRTNFTESLPWKYGSGATCGRGVGGRMVCCAVLCGAVQYHST